MSCCCPAAGSVACGGLANGADHLRMVLQSQIIVRGEVDDASTVNFNVCRINRANDAAAAVKVGIAQASELPANELVPIGQVHEGRRSGVSTAAFTVRRGVGAAGVPGFSRVVAFFGPVVVGSGDVVHLVNVAGFVIDRGAG